jgi:hypothetical protein
LKNLQIEKFTNWKIEKFTNWKIYKMNSYIQFYIIFLIFNIISSNETSKSLFIIFLSILSNYVSDIWFIILYFVSSYNYIFYILLNSCSILFNVLNGDYIFNTIPPLFNI